MMYYNRYVSFVIRSIYTKINTYIFLNICTKVENTHNTSFYISLSVCPGYTSVIRLKNGAFNKSTNTAAAAATTRGPAESAYSIQTGDVESKSTEIDTK